MATANWGWCKDCEWWQIEPEAKISNTTMGLCSEEDLQPFHLRVSGNSGCTQYLPVNPHMLQVRVPLLRPRRHNVR